MNEKSILIRQISSLVLVYFVSLGLVACCSSKEFNVTVLPIREGKLRYELALPADSASVADAAAFVASGGSNEDLGFDENPVDSTVVSLLLQFEESSDSNLTLSVFEANPQIAAYFDQSDYIHNIVNSCNEEPPPLHSHRAYNYDHFYYVFIIESIQDSVTGDVIPPAEREFSKLIIMKDFAAEGVK
jgi:hypothetical protein